MGSKIFENKGKIVRLVIFLWVLLVGIVMIPKVFAVLQPVKSIEIFSEKQNYKTEEAGSWKITKSAKWISKGKALITFDIDTVQKSDNYNKDVLLVLDLSSSMNGERLNQVKADTIGLIEELLVDDKNKVGLITFNESSQIVSDFSNDKKSLVNKINDLKADGSTNYYEALKDVDSVLKNYTKVDGRECVVLFLTDGYPNEGTPNEKYEYDYLKSQYPFVIINGIQYEMGEHLLSFIKDISDNQYVANTENLSDTLKTAAITPATYDKFEISDYIDTNYFDVLDVKDIKTSYGLVNFDKNRQKIDFILDGLMTGLNVNITIEAKLKQNLGKEINYSTNSKVIVKSKLNEVVEDVTNLKTPVLTDNYKVIYDGNEPSGCNLEVPSQGNYSVFDTVEISSVIPKCEGYEFKGWNITTENVEKINNNYFIMPEEDVSIKAVWSKLSIEKSMTGKVQEKLTLYKQMQQDVNDSSKHAKKYTGPTGTFKGNEDIYYYERGAANNYVIFGGYCWNMIRTTDTGGVKLLYGGLPTVDGRCTNIPENAYLTKEQMNMSSEKIAFSDSFDSLSVFGYMNNTKYDIKNRTVTRKKSTVLNTYATKPTTAFYYADDYTWDGTNYSLVNEEKLVWEDNYQNLVGKYSFGNSASVATSDKLIYVLGADEDMLYYIVLADGNGISEDKKETTITLSKTITNSSSGDYLLAEPIVVNRMDWYNNYEKYKGYYLCGGQTLECSATMMKEILTTDKNSLTFYFVKKYGNSFTYENGQYHLTDVIDTASLWNDDSLSNTHYTCFNSSGTCSTLSYVYYGIDDKLYYINLSKGKSVQDALNEMLYNSDVNKNDSQVKAAVDYWYQNNMKQYTAYLEDTVWCNDRGIRSDSEKTSGWNPNGGKINENLYFRTTEEEHDLTCINELDRFTVSGDNGNGKLKYPVGLLTKKENNLVEQGSGDMPYIWGDSFGLMSPGYLSGNAFAFYISNSKEGYKSSGANVVVRPSVSLRAGIEYSRGNGSASSPYVIDLSADEFRIRVSNEYNVNLSKRMSLPGETIVISSNLDGYSVSSFKMNGKLINGSSFVMPEEDVIITDIVTEEKVVFESIHNPYDNNTNETKEKTFAGATSLTVVLDYQTESTSYDYIYLYDSTGKSYGKYGGTTKKSVTLTIPGNYVKISFISDYSNSNYYGYKATITPNY